MPATRTTSRTKQSGPSTPGEVHQFLVERKSTWNHVCWNPDEPNEIQKFLSELNSGRPISAMPPAMKSALNSQVPRFEKESEPRILIFDDERAYVESTRKHLAELGYKHCVGQTDSRMAFDDITRYRPDLIILEAIMPNVSGIQMLRKLRANSSTAQLPVLVLTAAGDRETRRIVLESGATDFLSKPIDPDELEPRVQNALMINKYHGLLRKRSSKIDGATQMRSADLDSSGYDLIHCLARTAEFHDDNTGHHVLRIGRYASLIARAMNLGDTVVEQIKQAAQLHDIGKIGIPDSILLKTGKLEPEEITRMRKHTFIGKRVIERPEQQELRFDRGHVQNGAQSLYVPRSPVLQMAGRIALTHHEWWDGSGYPMGLAGEDIPIEGRITAVADVFDALSTRRLYKPSYPREKCFEMIREEKETHFDPDVVDAFFSMRREIVQTQLDLADDDVDVQQ